jgi:hypothetical protein
MPEHFSTNGRPRAVMAHPWMSWRRSMWIADYLIVNEIPQNKSTGEKNSSESKRKYFERTKDLMYRKSKKHECWVDDSWYQELRKQVESSSLCEEVSN